jgi:biopolymer transport protein ExbD
MGASALPSDKDDGGDQIVAEINVTPLTDIFLVLLIIFMVTTTIVQNEGKNIQLPEGTQSEDAPPQGVTVAVGGDGRIQVNDRVVTREELLGALEAAIERAEDKIVVLRGDKSILYGDAVFILDLAQQAGAKGISIATQRPSS